MNPSTGPTHSAIRGLLALALFAALCLALSGCSYYTLSQDPTLDTEAFRSNPPASLAVMPVRDDTSHSPRGKNGRRLDEAARRVLYTALSTLHYRDVELTAVDEAIASRSLTLNLQPLDLPPAAFENSDLADALLYARVRKRSKFWLFIYSHVRLGMDLRMIDSRTGQEIYSNRATIHNRRVSLPVSIGGIVESLFLTLWHLRDSEIDNSLEEFGRRLARDFPDPRPSSSLYVAIDDVFVAPSKAVLRAGDRIDVEVRGTPNQVASYDIGRDVVGQPLEEKAPGVYIGTYQVKPGDLCETGIVRATLRSAYGSETASMSDVGGSFRIDAARPPRPQIHSVEFEKDALTLNLALPRPAEDVAFHIYRSENPAHGYLFQGRADELTWRDRNIRSERRYWYLVKTVDREGNPSLTSEPYEIHVPRKGPTVLPSNIEGTPVLQRFSSPYIVIGTCRVPAGSVLRVEPGVALRVSEGSQLLIQGDALFAGSKESPIRIEATPSGTPVRFAPTCSTGTLVLQNVRCRKARTAIDAIDGNLLLRGVQFEEIAQTAVRIEKARRLLLSRCVFSKVRTAVEGSAQRAEINYCLFDKPDRAVSLYAPSLLLANNDFEGNGLAVAQLSPITTPVDQNFFDTTDPWALLQRIQGPCVFRRIYGSRSAERLAFAPYPESYETYRARGDHFYEGRAWEPAMRAYFRAWWLRKEPRVGTRLVELLRRGSPIRVLLPDNEQLRAALSVARTLAIMQPDNAVALNLYADVLEQVGFDDEAKAIRERAKMPPRTPLSTIQDLGGRLKEGVRDFITP
ncbi:hypothetical protein JW916_16540 [Candidatus Sumerlaeota bacterium]|nr:hypothetical protein [Candidatus Sumerlaeota bacterium]